MTRPVAVPRAYTVSHAIAWPLALLVPLAYLWFYTPYGMDTTDFGFFYGYPWRILQGEIPYRDFYYINPSFPLFWHAFWLKVTPEHWGVLGGKAGFVAAMLAASWMLTLFLGKTFDLERMGVPAPLLATAGFVWGVHAFAHVPWHTVDGIFFAAAALWTGGAGHPLLAGLLACLSALTKQSYFFVPLGVATCLFFLRPRKREALYTLAAALLGWLAWWAFLRHVGAWDAFRNLTSKPLDIAEALEAGIFIYLRQEWWLPALASVPWLAWFAARRFAPATLSALRLPSTLPQLLQPGILYLWLIAVRYVHEVFAVRSWTGFGESWPTLWLVLGGVCVLLPATVLRPWLRDAQAQGPHALLRAATALGAPLLVAWSAGISGGYKTPALCALPLLFAFLLVHARLGGKAALAAWTALVLGLIMFRAGYEYPYTFPIKQLARAHLIYDAGEVFPKASGVMVDKDMYETLRELKELRARYGKNYRVLPGFPHAYYLTGDAPAFPSEWLLDWQIVNQFDKVYQELVDRDITVFMLRDQMDTEQADGYARAGYTVPQMVRKRWRIVEETPHFVVMRPPVSSI